MQNAVPKGEGGMLAVLGSSIKDIEKLIQENEDKFKVQIANDNSEGQIVLSGKNIELEKLIEVLKSNNIKNIKLPVRHLYYWLIKCNRNCEKEIEN